MAKITINFADDIKFQRDLEANCRLHGYEETITNEEGVVVPNPQTKQDFIEAWYKNMFKRDSKTKRTQEAVTNLNIEE